MSEFMGIKFQTHDKLKGDQMVMYDSKKILVRTSDGAIHEFTWDEVAEIQKKKPRSARHK